MEARRPAVIHAAALAAALLLVAVAGVPAGAHDPITTRVTFSREIRAILAAHCTVCHARGGSAPMPLVTYEDVRPWARAIKEQALTRRMPKWHAARGFGAFADDPTLTPFEIALVVAWVDGGVPRGAGRANAIDRRIAGDKGDVAVVVPPRGTEGGGRVGTRWISGWSFEPGDPLIASATVTLADGTLVGSWTAGDPPVVLPAGSGLRVSPRLQVRINRRAPADFEKPYTARPSVLRVVAPATAPTRRVWIEHVTCPSAPGSLATQLLAVRPALAEKASARLSIERMGGVPSVIGWFRDFDPGYARTYWLARPVEFAPDTRLVADAACDADLVLIGPLRRRPVR